MQETSANDQISNQFPTNQKMHIWMRYKSYLRNIGNVKMRNSRTSQTRFFCHLEDSWISFLGNWGGCKDDRRRLSDNQLDGGIFGFSPLYVFRRLLKSPAKLTFVSFFLFFLSTFPLLPHNLFTRSHFRCIAWQYPRICKLFFFCTTSDGTLVKRESQYFPVTRRNWI